MERSFSDLKPQLVPHLTGDVCCYSTSTRLDTYYIMDRPIFKLFTSFYLSLSFQEIDNSITRLHCPTQHTIYLPHYVLRVAVSTRLSTTGRTSTRPLVYS
jgi:hypothetical protein